MLTSVGPIALAPMGKPSSKGKEGFAGWTALCRHLISHDVLCGMVIAV